MASNIKLKNAQNSEFTVTHEDNQGAISVSSTDLAKVVSVDTIADLRLTTKAQPTVWVSGYHTKGDGAFGSNIFEWDATSVEADNGGTIIKLDSIATGRYKLRFSGAVSVKWFGDTNLEQTFKNASDSSNDSVYVESGTYTLEGDTIDFTSNKFHSYGDVTINVNTTLSVENISVESIHPKTFNNSSRSIIQYRSAHEVRIPSGVMSFSGFRAKGQYKKEPTKFLVEDTAQIIDTQTNLDYNMTRKQESWYAVFACANDGDTTITYKTVPFFRLHSVISGTHWYLSENTGEGKHTVGSTYAYTWDFLDAIGNEVLICSETIDGRPNAISDRVTTINNGGSNSIGFVDAGGVGALDYVLPAPNFDHYRYLGSFYEDTAEVRNIADSGKIVATRGINQQQLPSTGGQATTIPLSVAGYICPLATAVRLNTSLVINDTSSGQYLEYFLTDSTHDVDNFNWNKTTTETSNLSQHMIIPFSFKQEYWWQAVGNTANRTSGQHSIYGWIEE